MRNWNTSVVIVRELRSELPDYLWGIETNESCDPKVLIHVRFQTTYEELKQDIHFWIAVSGFASRLPMRNWNLAQVTDFGLGSELPDYLWGIETSRTRFLWIRKQELPDYLWGIETAPCCSSPFVFNSASRLPMRNWNQILRCEYHLVCEASRLPMRNWNKIFISESLYLVSLPDYLWGIETSPPQSL